MKVPGARRTWRKEERTAKSLIAEEIVLEQPKRRAAGDSKHGTHNEAFGDDTQKKHDMSQVRPCQGVLGQDRRTGWTAGAGDDGPWRVQGRLQLETWGQGVCTDGVGQGSVATAKGARANGRVETEIYDARTTHHKPPRTSAWVQSVQNQGGEAPRRGEIGRLAPSHRSSQDRGIDHVSHVRGCVGIWE
jgi:hypothetical protein